MRLTSLLPLIALSAIASAQTSGSSCSASRTSENINGFTSSAVTLAAGATIGTIEDWYECEARETSPYAAHFFYAATLQDQSGAERTAYLNVSFDYNDGTTVQQVLFKGLDDGDGFVNGFGNLCLITIDGQQYTFPPNTDVFEARYGASAAGSIINVTLNLLQNNFNSTWATGTSRELDLTGLSSPAAAFVITDLDDGKTYDFTLEVELEAATSITYYASSNCQLGSGNSWTLELNSQGSGTATFSISPEDGKVTYFIYAVRDEESTGSFQSAKLTYEGSGGSSDPCFPASATALLATGASTPLASLNIGDTIATGSSSAPHSPVFFFSHRTAHKSYPFTRILTADGNAIALWDSHYIFANGKLTAAREVVPGDRLERGDGEAVAVVSIEKRVWLQGLYNPHTVADTMVVDGFKVSCFTTAVEPRLARALLWPLKVAFETMGVAMPGAFLRDGWDRVAQMIPGGKGRYEAV